MVCERGRFKGCRRVEEVGRKEEEERRGGETLVGVGSLSRVTCEWG